MSQKLVPGWKQAMSESDQRTLDFLRLISLPHVSKILTRLAQGPALYTDLMTTLCEKNRTGKAAHYLKRLKDHSLITKNRRHYTITWRGLKALQFYGLVHQIQNMDISSYDPQTLNQSLQVESSRTWLEPYLENLISRLTKR